MARLATGHCDVSLSDFTEQKASGRRSNNLYGDIFTERSIVKMSILRKILALVLVSVVLSLNTTGCGKKSETTPEEHPSQGASSEESSSQEHPAAEHPSGEHPSGEHPQ